VIVRELVAMFGIDFDQRGLRQAESGVGRLRNMLGGLGVSLSFGAAGYGLSKLADMASDVDEQMNVIQQTFQENTQGVLDWSKATGEAVGRSQFTLQKYAGSLGSLLTPMLDGNREKSAELSTTLSQLAVDLGSFFNVADDDVLVALRAGIVGETEPMRRLGVELTEASLSAFAAERGMKANLKTMTNAEKVQLRFAKIMADTVDKQGDAARTAQGYANSSKRLSETMKDLGIEVGQKLLPSFTSLVHWAIELAQSFSGIVKDSQLVEAGLITLGGLAAVLAVQFALANLPVILFAAGLAAVVLVVEDLMGALRGAKSVTGAFFEGLLGKEQWAEIRDTWKSFSEEIGNYVWEMLHPGQTMPRAKTADLNSEVEAPKGGLVSRLGAVLPQSARNALDEFAGRGGQGTPEQRAAGERVQASLKNASLGSFFAAMIGNGSPFAETLANAKPAPSLTAGPAVASAGPSVSIGDVNVHVGAGATPDAVREGERAAQRVQDRRTRDLARTATGY
jgi:hypothetical protein